MKPLNRRSFLKTALFTMGTFSQLRLFQKGLFGISQTQSFAATREPHFLLQIIVGGPGAVGGMDVVMGLDPIAWQEGSRFEESDLFLGFSNLKPAGNLFLGPAAEPLRPYANDIGIINGIVVSDTDQFHDTNRDHMRTGTPIPSLSRATVPVEIAELLGPLPLGILFNDSLTDGLPPILGNRPVSPFEISQLKTDAVGRANRERFKKMLPLYDDDENSFLAAAREMTKTAEFIPAIQDQMLKLQTIAGNQRFSEIHWPSAVASAFLLEASAQAEVAIRPAGGTLDSHSDHYQNHLIAQTSIWSQVATLFQFFKQIPYKGGSLFDNTTFVVMSEFSRTPFLNRYLGKDHNPFTNSVLLAGKGIHGGTAAGVSSLYTASDFGTVKKDSPEYNALASDGTIRSAHVGLNYDFANSRSLEKNQPGGCAIRPEHVARTLRNVFGVRSPKDALETQDQYFKLLIKT